MRTASACLEGNGSIFCVDEEQDGCLALRATLFEDRERAYRLLVLAADEPEPVREGAVRRTVLTWMVMRSRLALHRTGWLWPSDPGQDECVVEVDGEPMRLVLVPA